MKLTYRKTSKETSDEIVYSVALSATEIETSQDADLFIDHLKKANLDYEGQTTLEESTNQGDRD